MMLMENMYCKINYDHSLSICRQSKLRELVLPTRSNPIKTAQIINKHPSHSKTNA